LPPVIDFTRAMSPQLKHRRLLRRRVVMEMLGIKRTALEEAVKRDDFPKPIVIFKKGRALAWNEDEVLTWLDERFKAQRP
jgi:predicted DNA-binding transcriptional regulator AlpA